MTRSIFFLFILIFAGACKPGKTGAFLGGMTDSQFHEFDGTRSNWTDARAAYRGTASVSSTSARASRMSGLLKNSAQCAPSMAGGEDLNLALSSDSNQRGMGGSQCAVTADERMDWQKSAAVGAFGMNHTYHVVKNSFGMQYQREDDVRDVAIGGSFSVYKQTNGFRTFGTFNITMANKNDPREDTLKGHVDVGNTGVEVTITLPSGWDLKATATWSHGSFGAPVTYTVMNSTVTASEFNSAFEDFRIPEIIRYAQEIPNHL